MTLGQLIDARLLARDRRDTEARGQRHPNGTDLRSSLQGLWSPLQAQAQLGRRLAWQRKRWFERWGEAEETTIAGPDSGPVQFPGEESYHRPRKRVAGLESPNRLER